MKKTTRLIASEEALEKWDGIINKGFIDHQSDNCALCKTYDCPECPLEELGLACYTLDSPYRCWELHVGTHLINVCDICGERGRCADKSCPDISDDDPRLISDIKVYCPECTVLAEGVRKAILECIEYAKNLEIIHEVIGEVTDE